jgi:hypothetical protein
MANTTFNGPVRSENGFQTVTKNATTGAVTVTATINGGTIILPNLPTADPLVAGQLWNDGGILTVSAG